MPWRDPYHHICHLACRTPIVASIANKSLGAGESLGMCVWNPCCKALLLRHAQGHARSSLFPVGVPPPGLRPPRVGVAAAPLGRFDFVGVAASACAFRPGRACARRLVSRWSTLPNVPTQVGTPALTDMESYPHTHWLRLFRPRHSDCWSQVNVQVSNWEGRRATARNACTNPGNLLLVLQAVACVTLHTKGASQPGHYFDSPSGFLSA